MCEHSYFEDIDCALPSVHGIKNLSRINEKWFNIYICKTSALFLLRWDLKLIPVCCLCHWNCVRISAHNTTKEGSMLKRLNLQLPLNPKKLFIRACFTLYASEFLTWQCLIESETYQVSYSRPVYFGEIWEFVLKNLCDCFLQSQNSILIF